MVKTPSLLDLISLIPAGDLTRAAKAVGLTPETLKKRVEAVESVLGFKLVNTAAPNDTVSFTGMLSADSVIWASAPFTPPGAPAGSPQMQWIAVGRGAGNAWTGTAVTMVAGTDSVVQNSRWTATRM